MRGNNHKSKPMSRDFIPSKRPLKRFTKKFNISSQTAYHITRLSLEEQVTEGKIIDKVFRSYLTDLSIGNNIGRVI